MPVLAAERETAAERASSGRLLAAVLQRLGLTPELVRFALVVFVLSRAGFVLLTLLALRFLAPIGNPAGSFLDAWARYDATYYARIALDGYSAAAPWREGFFPLMPWLVHLVALPFESLSPRYQADYIAALVVSNAAYLVALLGLSALARRDGHDTAAARRAMLYLTLFPSALFLFAGYAESLFLALAIWCLVALRCQRWWLAGALGFLAALTRQAGVFLVLPFAFSYASAIGWQWRRVRANALAGLLFPAGLLAFMGWLWVTVGTPLGFVRAQSLVATHVFSPPWTTLWNAARLFVPRSHGMYFWRNVSDVLMLALIGALLIVGLRRLRPGDWAYSAALWLLVLSFATPLWPLLSDARYMLEAFPCLLLLAQLTRRPWQTALVLAVFTLLLVMQTQFFVRGALIL